MEAPMFKLKGYLGPQEFNSSQRKITIDKDCAPAELVSTLNSFQAVDALGGSSQAGFIKSLLYTMFIVIM